MATQYLVSDLLLRALWLSSVVARESQTPTSTQTEDALFLFRELLGSFSFSTRIIPYFKKHNLTCITGQNTYFVPRLLDVQTFAYYIDDVRMPSQYMDRKAFNGSAQATSTESLPLNWNFERCVGGGNINIYFKPNENFPMIITGKFGYDYEVSPTDDLLLVYDMGYLRYLRYRLAKEICSEYKKVFSQECVAELEKIEAELEYTSPPDLTIQKISLFGANNYFNYAVANFGPWY